MSRTAKIVDAVGQILPHIYFTVWVRDLIYDHPSHFRALASYMGHASPGQPHAHQLAQQYRSYSIADLILIPFDAGPAYPDSSTNHPQRPHLGKIPVVGYDCGGVDGEGAGGLDGVGQF